MKIKTNELIGPDLDAAVARSLGWVNYPADSKEQGLWWHTEPGIAPRGHEHNRIYAPNWKPSTDGGQGVPIIERECIGTLPPDGHRGGAWSAFYWNPSQHDLTFDEALEYRCVGSTALIAAMRCFVASRLGEEVEVPDECV